MNCTEIRWRMDAMLDDQLDSETKSVINRHCEQCLDCHAILHVDLAARKMLHNFRKKVEMPESLPAKIRELIATKPASSAALSVVKYESLPIEEDESSPSTKLSNPANSLTSMLLRDDLIEVFAGLSSRERDVLRLRFGLDDGRQRTLEEVGELFGVTPERMRQIEAKAMRKLRHPNRRRSTFAD